MIGGNISHNLKRYTLRANTNFRVDVVDGKEYPYFLRAGKKIYFIHPSRDEFSLTDDQVTAMFADTNGKFAQAKSAYFVEAVAGAPVEKTVQKTGNKNGE